MTIKNISRKKKHTSNPPTQNPMLTQDENIIHLSIVFCSFLAKSVALISLLLAVVCSFKTFTTGFAVSPILPCVLCVCQFRTWVAKICVSADKQTGVDKIRLSVFSHTEYIPYDNLVSV